MTPEQKKAIAVANARMRMQQQSQPAEQQSANSTGQTAQQQPASFGERFLSGASDPVVGLNQLMYNALPQPLQRGVDYLTNKASEVSPILASPMPEGGYNEFVRQREQQIQQNAPDGVDWGRVAGNVLSPVNILPAARMAPAASAGGRIAQGVGLGGFAGATTPITEQDYGTELAKNVALGAALGGAGASGIEGLSRIVSPKASVNPMVQFLKGQGVRLTPGQALGGAVGRTEEKLASIPVLGDKIAARRGESISQFNTATLNKAGESIGFKTQKTGVDALTDLDDAVTDAYQKAVDAAPAVQVDQQFIGAMQNIRQMAATQAFPEASQKAVDLNIQRMVSGIEKNGKLLPETWKKIDSELGQSIQKAKDPQFQDAMRELQRQWRDVAGRSSPEQRELFRAADKAYTGLERLTKATYRSAQDMGEFTPAQLFSVAKQGASKTGLRQQTAPFLRDAMEAQEVLGNRVPNSGTFDRAILPATIAGGFIDPMTALMIGTGASAYTRPGAQLLTGAVTNRPQSAQALARALQRTSPAAGLIAAQPIE